MRRSESYGAVSGKHRRIVRWSESYDAVSGKHRRKKEAYSVANINSEMR